MTSVLVAEDEFRIREVLVDTLLDAGYDVVDASNGIEAIQKAKEFAPDIVLLDVMMPVLDGFQAMQQMKADPDTEFIPVILLTAMPAAQGEVAAMEMWSSHYVTKPCDMGVLEATIRVALREAGVSLPSDLPEEPEQMIITNDMARGQDSFCSNRRERYSSSRRRWR